MTLNGYLLPIEYFKYDIGNDQRFFLRGLEFCDLSGEPLGGDRSGVLTGEGVLFTTSGLEKNSIRGLSLPESVVVILLKKSRVGGIFETFSPVKKSGFFRIDKAESLLCTLPVLVAVPGGEV